MECVFSLSLKTYGSHPKPRFPASCHAQIPSSISGKSSLDCVLVVSHSDKIHLSSIKASRTLLGPLSWGHIKGGPLPPLGSLPKQAVLDNSSSLHFIIPVTGRKAWMRCQGVERQKRVGEHGSNPVCHLYPWPRCRLISNQGRGKEKKGLVLFIYLFLVVRKGRQNIFISKTPLKSNVIAIDDPDF